LNEAEASFRKALQIKPDFALAYSGLLFLHAYHATLDPVEYLSLARGWELACVPAAEREAAHRRSFGRPPPAGRRLKIAYVSGDFRQHAVSYFIEQLFARHNRARVELYAYSTAAMRDAVTERLQALAEHWLVVTGLSDEALRQRIEADGIDVLVDLSGHTAHNRLGAFARRAAPVQVHYLGYFASTGLTEMDYFIGDAVLTPPETDSHFRERVWRLPRIRASYDGRADAPEPAWQPDPAGTVWVGSFSNLGKLTPETFALWAQVLHALPQGKLLLKTRALADAGNCRRILDTMAGHGIAPQRIELQSSEVTPGWREHMAYYDRLDIVLDPVGAHGGYTTSCDALWMGVPVVTLEGDRMASRMTASILAAIGHAEWIAHSEAEYVDKVVALAGDRERRKALRSAQRECMAASPLCDAQDLASKLEEAYSEMFERQKPA
jgi:predicted O-linked N-acetylglucosamine transferase (SPINDLY family)